MTPQEELARRANRVPDFAREAERLNKKAVARAVKSAGPLFAEHAAAETPRLTPTDAYWRWRRQLAQWGADPCACFSPMGKALGWLRLAAIEAHVRGLVRDDALFDRLRANVRTTYPMPEYGPDVWFGALTGRDRIQLRVWAVDEPDGRRRIEREEWPAPGGPPPMTREEFDRLFAIPEPEHTDGGPDAELHARFVTRLKTT